MAKGIDLSVAADTRSAMSAINRGLLEPLEDVSEQLEQLGDDSKQAGDKLERGMRDAQRRTDDAADEIKKLRDELNRAGRAGKTTGDDIDDGLDRVKHAAAETGDELKQNLGETFSSFRGDLEDLPQIAQDVFGGLAGSVGTLPAAFGLAAGAAGIGLLINAFQGIEAERQKLEDRAGSLAQAYIDAGTTVLDTVTLASRVSEVLTDPEKRADAQKLVDVLGVDLPEAARILAGDTNALATAQDVLADKNAKLNDQRATGKLLTEEEAAALADQQNALDNAGSSLDTYATNNAKAADIARDYSDALKGMVNDAGDVGVEIDDLGNKLISLPDGKQILIDAETGQATTDVARFKGDTDGVIDQLNGRDVVLSVKSELVAAQRDVDGFIVRNNGRTIQLKSRVISAEGDWQ
ncbi:MULTISPECIES: hypothetical protein [unclassified Microbacterium]|uniref:hypothetical protein n=1 Tax=unclassified Microbacterium TaxID=2609290 RepID=UPI00342458D2